MPVSFLGGVDPGTARVLDPDSDVKGESIAHKIFSFPFGKGSTVGSYSIYQMKLNGHAPSAIVNETAEPIVATGAIIADIPMVDGVETGLVKSGDSIVVDADSGTVEISGVAEKHVVTCIVRNKERILLLQRSHKVGSYRRLWAGVSGFIEAGESDEAAARREMAEEASLGTAKLTRHIDPIRFRDGPTVWTVHPFLFDVKDDKVVIDWEHQAYEWISPDRVYRYKTVPGLDKVISRLVQ